jgi:uncharacterized protein
MNNNAFQSLDLEISTRMKQKKQFIQVILGPRQVGKTTFIKLFVSKNKKEYHYVSADGVAESNWIFEQWQWARSNKKTLIIDEIQKVPQWSEMIKKIWDSAQEPKKMILLGSSSLNLQKGLSESLTGRYEILRAYHWNYSSTQKLKKMSLDQFLIYGGYPGSYPLLEDSQRWQEYLQSSIVETVISKDILMQAQVKSPALFRQSFYAFANYPGQVVSYNKILGQLQDKGNIDLVKYYLDLYDGAYLIKTIQKYSNNEVKKRQSSPKIICMAPSLSCFHRLDNLTPEYMGRVFESLVGAQLIKNFEKVFYWQELDFEVDFILKYKGQVIAIEVKSGRKKKTRSLDVFLTKNPKAIPLFINKENYSQFELDPVRFIESMI